MNNITHRTHNITHRMHNTTYRMHYTTHRMHNITHRMCSTTHRMHNTTHRIHDTYCPWTSQSSWMLLFADQWIRTNTQISLPTSCPVFLSFLYTSATYFGPISWPWSVHVDILQLTGSEMCVYQAVTRKMCTK